MEVSLNVTEDNVLEINLDRRLVARVPNARGDTDANEELADDVLAYLGYIPKQNNTRNDDSKVIEKLDKIASDNLDIRNSLKCIYTTLLNGNCSETTPEVPDDTWSKDITAFIKESRKHLPPKIRRHTKDFIDMAVDKLRDVYGYVASQAIKEYKNKYEIDGAVNILDVISEDETYRDIFTNIVKDLVCATPRSESESNDSIENLIRTIIKPLAEKYNDDSNGWNKTFRVVYGKMNCSWSNLETRHMRAYGCATKPRKITIVARNRDAFMKFKKTVNTLLEEE